MLGAQSLPRREGPEGRPRSYPTLPLLQASEVELRALAVVSLPAGFSSSLTSLDLFPSRFFFKPSKGSRQ